VSIDVTSLYNRRADNRWERTCVGDILERVTWSRPDRVAITGWAGAFGDPAYERLTYRQADEAANRFANGLLASGLTRGDRVLLICENSVEAYLAKIATAKAGLVAVPVNPALAPDVLAYLIRLAEPPQPAWGSRPVSGIRGSQRGFHSSSARHGPPAQRASRASRANRKTTRRRPRALSGGSRPRQEA